MVQWTQMQSVEECSLKTQVFQQQQCQHQHQQSETQFAIRTQLWLD